MVHLQVTSSAGGGNSLWKDIILASVLKSAISAGAHSYRGPSSLYLPQKQHDVIEAVLLDGWLIRCFVWESFVWGIRHLSCELVLPHGWLSQGCQVSKRGESVSGKPDSRFWLMQSLYCWHVCCLAGRMDLQVPPPSSPLFSPSPFRHCLSAHLFALLGLNSML